MDNREVVPKLFIQDLSGKIGKEWKLIGRGLILSDAQLSHIESDNQNNEREKIIQMLLNWRRSNGPKATYNVLNEALRNAGRSDLVKSFDGDKLENTSLTERQKTGDENGFGRFLVDAASIITLSIALQLAAVYGLPKPDVDKILMHVDHGWMLLDILKQREDISSTDISSLTDALDRIRLDGIVARIKDSFVRNVSVDLSRQACFLSTEDNSRRIFTKKKHQFLKEISETYAEMYNGVQPIPYIRDRLLCVNQVFIDSGLEYLDKGDGNNPGKVTWIKLASYNSIFTEHCLSQAMVFLLYGEPGYGKSTLALQYVYDWCHRCSGSPLKEVEMLIFLRLRYLRGGMPIAKAIKEFLLPSDTTLTELDVLKIIESCKSVLLVFDGLDEYSDKDLNGKDDVTKIITRQMFRDYKLVLTTRPSGTPPKRSYATQQLRLTGFDDQAKEMYILKAIAEENTEVAGGILRRLQQNPIVADICQVSLFFVMFAHMAYDRSSSLVLDSVTSFFRYVIACFYKHIHIKAGAESTAMKGASIKKHQKLDKVAFESLQGNNQHLVWSRETLAELIEEPLYYELVEIGILVEENVVGVVDKPGTSAADLIQRRKDVSFYHKLFCEWYAAHYVAEHLKCLTTPDDVQRFFSEMDPFDLQYVYRIACGLNSDAADVIIKHLNSIEGGDKFAILCILEQTGKVDKIIDNIRQICFEGVIISGYDSLLLQRSTMQLLEIAATNQIPIEYVILSNCLQSVDLSTASIRTTSGLAFTSRIPVKRLSIYLFNRDMTKDEAIDILQFTSMCPSLRHLWYDGCVPPREFTDLSLLSSLKSSDVTVRWQWAGKKPWYMLNLHTGRWENKNDGSEPTEEDFERMLSQGAELRTELTEAIHKEVVKGRRKRLREIAEERKNKQS